MVWFSCADILASIGPGFNLGSIGIWVWLVSVVLIFFCIMGNPPYLFLVFCEYISINGFVPSFNCGELVHFSFFFRGTCFVSI
jgi:hypothetical protein